MAAQDKIKREVLPIPEKPCVGLSTFTPRDPETRFPLYEPLRPPEGAPNVLKILLDEGGFWRLQRLRRPGQHPYARHV